MKREHLTATLIASFIASMLVFAWFNNWILFNSPFGASHDHLSQEAPISKKQIPFYFYKNNQTNHETKEILWSTNTADNLTQITQTWLTLLDEEELLIKKSSLQATVVSDDGNTAFLSFDRPPFNDEAATFYKWITLENLLQIIRETIPKLQSIQFLAHHRPIDDYHLDFSRPWPTIGFTKKEDNPLPGTRPWDNKRTITIMLDPAGDAQSTGRIIGDSFERGITLQYAQELKKVLENQAPYVRVILTRFPGETLEPLQNAAFSNRLNADLYISLNFYPAEKGLSHFFIYNFVYDPVTDFWNKKSSQLAFTPYNAAHLTNLSQSSQAASLIHEALKNIQSQGLFALEPLQSIPFKPLVGVQATALGCEIGLHKKDDWRLFVEPLAQALIAVL